MSGEMAGGSMNGGDENNWWESLIGILIILAIVGATIIF